MGVVKKQAYKNTIVSYLGYIVGAVNIALYPRFLGTEGAGLIQLLIAVSIFFSLISAFGAPGIIVRFFPHYRTEDKSHSGFIKWIGLICIGGFILCSIFFLILKPLIISAFIENSALFVRYYNWVIPLGFFLLFFNFFEAVGKVAYQTIYSSFLKDVLVRVLTTVEMILVALGYISFDDFVVIYIGLNGLVAVLLCLSILKSGQFLLKLPENHFAGIKRKDIINYGSYTLFAGVVIALLQKVDVLMLSSMTGLSEQGVYSTFFNIAVIIGVPAQALNRTTYQIVSDSWKEHDFKNVNNIYSKTSIIQMTIGCLLFIGVIVNKDNLLAILKKPEFESQFEVFILIGLASLVDITGGLNLHIISVSDKYRLVTVLTVASSLCCVIMNYFFIPIMGGKGAALAYLVSLTAINFYSWLFIKQNFKMQPFTSKHMVVIVVSAVCYLLGHYLWKMPELYLDIFVRSSVVALIFGSLIYLFKVSPDINEKVDDTFQKIKGRFFVKKLSV